MAEIASDSMSHAGAQEVERNDRPGRTAEFTTGAGKHAKAIRPDPFVEARYGDRKQIPTNGPRRGGPLPYPLTREEHDWLERDRWWSHSE